MALITNGQDIQNAIYGVLKQDGYLIFLASGLVGRIRIVAA